LSNTIARVPKPNALPGCNSTIKKYPCPAQKKEEKKGKKRKNERNKGKKQSKGKKEYLAQAVAQPTIVAGLGKFKSDVVEGKQTYDFLRLIQAE
jgi:hypothetical protein